MILQKQRSLSPEPRPPGRAHTPVPAASSSAPDGDFADGAPGACGRSSAQTPLSGAADKRLAPEGLAAEDLAAWETFHKPLALESGATTKPDVQARAHDLSGLDVVDNGATKPPTPEGCGAGRAVGPGGVASSAADRFQLEQLVPCVHAGCEWTGPRHRYWNHVKDECEQRVVCCPHKGCVWRKPYCLKPQHLLSCPQRRWECPCGWVGTHEQCYSHKETCASHWQEVLPARQPQSRGGGSSAGTSPGAASGNVGTPGTGGNAPRSAPSRASAAIPQHLAGDRGGVAYEASMTRRRRAANKQPGQGSRLEAMLEMPGGPVCRVRRPQPNAAEAPSFAEAPSDSLGAAGLHRQAGLRLSAATELQPPIADDVALEFALKLSEMEASLNQGHSVGGMAGEEDEVCAVCLEPLAGTLATGLPRCDHCFHLACIYTMTMPKTGGLTCAICRADFLWEEVRPPGPAPLVVDQAIIGTSTALPAVAAVEANQHPGAITSVSTDEQQDLDATPQASSIDNGGRVLARSWRAARRDPRFQCIRSIFRECDSDHDGRLQLQELRTFAIETGFNDGEEVWGEEYAAICADGGVDPKRGLHEAAFTALVNDKSDAGCYCGDDELHAILLRLRATRLWRQDPPHSGLQPHSAAADQAGRASELKGSSEVSATATPGDAPSTEAQPAATLAQAARPIEPAEEESRSSPACRSMYTAEAERRARARHAGADGLAEGADARRAAAGAELHAAAAVGDGRRGGGAAAAAPAAVRSGEGQRTERHLAALQRSVQAARRSQEDERLAEACLQVLSAMLAEHPFEDRRWSVSAFGSAVNGFGMAGCDLDVVVHGPPAEAGADLTPQASRSVLLELRSLLAGSAFLVKEAIWLARVPILKLQFGELEVDLSVNNTKPLLNTQLLKAYASLHPSVSELGVAVKLWAKERGLCGAASGHLSSYALVLMVIYFLQVACTPPLPCLPTEQLLHGATCPEALRAGASWACSEPLHVLLCSFVAFYGRDFRWGEEVVSVRLGRREVAPSAFELLPGRRAGALRVEDPIETSRDLANVLQVRQESQLRTTLRSGAQLLQRAGWPAEAAAALPPAVWPNFLQAPPAATVLRATQQPLSTSPPAWSPYVQQLQHGASSGASSQEVPGREPETLEPWHGMWGAAMPVLAGQDGRSEMHEAAWSDMQMATVDAGPTGRRNRPRLRRQPRSS